MICSLVSHKILTKTVKEKTEKNVKSDRRAKKNQGI